MPLTFFPLFCKDRGVQEGTIGLILSFYAIGMVISGPFIGPKLFKWGRHRILYTTMVISGISVVCFGLLKYIQNKYIFILVGCVLRFINGLVEGIISTVIYAFLPIFYPDTLSEKFSYLELSFSVACTSGAFIGGLLY